MVHRIQNRNPGYSDFSNTGSTQSFQFTNNSNSIITNGANALKIDEDVKSEELNSNNVDSNNLNEISNTLSGETLNKADASEVVNENSDFESKSEERETENNGLENFELSEDDAPELFNSDTNEEVLNTSDEINSPEEEDLEIPAFLRRQKN